MSKKYLTLDEAASMLAIAREELTRLRERGEIRGFADRGTWKFKSEDVQNLARSRQADSDPDVPLVMDESDSAIPSSADSSTILSRGHLAGSDSDVRLMPEPDGPSLSSQMSDSDSDVKLVGEGTDSDVKLADDADSDSDVKLVGDETVRELNMPLSVADSDSDVKIVDPQGAKSIPSDSAADRTDSDVQLLGDFPMAEEASDSDVAILGSDSDIALDFGSDADEHSSVLSDEPGPAISGSGLLSSSSSGVSLSGPNDSGIPLGADEDEGLTMAPDLSDSGISLAGAESGISLAGDSGISLSSADSGISLEAVADSGISLEDSNEYSGTVPMMDALRDSEGPAETKFELPSGDDSAFEIQKATDETGVMDDLSDSGEGALDDAIFDLDDNDADEVADLDVADDILGEDEEIEELDVFDADEGAFTGDDEDEEAMGAMGGRAAAPVDDEWSGGTVAMLGFTCVTTLLCSMLMLDLVRSMWMWGGRPVEPGLLMGLVSGLFGK